MAETIGVRVAALAAVLAWMAALCFADVRGRRLPNMLTLPGAAVIVAAAACCGRAVPALLGAAALGGVYLAVHLLAPSGMGAGDVKLALGAGALAGSAGVEAWLVAAVGAPLLTVAFAVLARNRVVPHGPSMCLATAAVLTAAWLP